MPKTLFEKIARGEIPADIVYEDAQCFCFRDIAPQAPTHLLLVPRKVIARIGEATDQDQSLLGHLLLTVGKIAKQLDFEASGFRIVINHGRNGGESVPHLHLHLLADRLLTWPPG